MLTPSGYRVIESLREGDLVVSFDLASQRLVERRILNVMVSRADALHRIDAGEFVVSGVTASHPFYDQSRNAFVRVDELTLVSVLLAVVPGGAPRPFKVNAITTLPTSGPSAEVFNLEVDGEHNYFAEGILVHNKSPTGGGYGGSGGNETTGGSGGSGGSGMETTGGTGGAGAAAGFCVDTTDVCPELTGCPDEIETATYCACSATQEGELCQVSFNSMTEGCGLALVCTQGQWVPDAPP